jgi:hypothetical protein
MRPRALIEIGEDRIPEGARTRDTYERVRRTLDDALSELELPLEIAADADRSAPHTL